MKFFSVIIPTYNRPESLLRLLESLAAQQGVDWDVGEVLVVDDGSNVSYEAALAGREWPFTLRLQRQENGGEARARNTGAAQARGELLLFLDDDMELSPGYVAAMYAEYERRPDWIFIGNMQTPVETDGTTFQRVMAAQLTPTVFGEVPFTAILAGVLGISAVLYRQLDGMKPITDKKRGGWIDLAFAYRAYQLGCCFFRVQSAVSLHHDTVANNFEAACQRFYRISSLATEVFIQYPELKPYVLIFSDKSPVDLKHDSFLLVLRKILRQCLSFPPIFCVLKQSVAIA